MNMEKFHEELNKKILKLIEERKFKHNLIADMLYYAGTKYTHKIFMDQNKYMQYYCINPITGDKPHSFDYVIKDTEIIKALEAEKTRLEKEFIEKEWMDILND